LFNKGITLSTLNRSEDAIKVYDELLALYKDRPEPQIAEQVAKALVIKGIILGTLNRSPQAEEV